jgi:transcriptional regulator GlxA family with amidase domain
MTLVFIQASMPVELAAPYELQANWMWPRVLVRLLMMDITPNRIPAAKSLARGCQALKQKRIPESKTLISTIAFSAGFNDLSYFNRLFRATFNCTPGQYDDACVVADSGN